MPNSAVTFLITLTLHTKYVLRNLLGKGRGGREGGAAQNEGK